VLFSLISATNSFFFKTKNLATAIVHTHTHEGTERGTSSDFFTLTGHLPTPIHVWIRANIQRFTNAPARSASSNPVSPRAAIPPARQSTPSMPNRSVKPARVELSRNGSANKSQTLFPSFAPPPVPVLAPPLAALEKIELIEKMELVEENGGFSPGDSYPNILGLRFIIYLIFFFK
jgi:hypothetical protein